MLAAAGLFHQPRAAAAVEPIPDVARMVAEIRAANVRRTVETLAGFGTRNTMSRTDSQTRGIGAARRWLAAELTHVSRSNGGRLEVDLDRFNHGPDGNRITRPTEIVNVVATLPGSLPASKDRCFIVSAHYDSMCTDPKDAECDAPGADDDASGCAVVLELARVMSARSFDATVVFMFVAGEEQGLIGSRHWAADARRRGVRIDGMFTNDIVGASRGPSRVDHRRRVRVFSEGVPVNETPEQAKLRLAVGSENDSAARQLARFIDEAAALYLPKFDVELVFRRDRYLRGGDHTAFSEQGYAAVRFTEYEEDYAHQHQTLRTEGGQRFGDLPEFCDYDYIADVARVNLAALATLVRAPAAPANVRIITTRLTNDTTLRWQSNAEPDLRGYEVVWRSTSAPLWEHSKAVGRVTEVTLPLSKDNVQFGVRAIDSEGYRSLVAFPLPAKE